MIGYRFRASRRQFLNGFEIRDSRKTLRTTIVVRVVLLFAVCHVEADISRRQGLDKIGCYVTVCDVKGHLGS